MNIQEKLKKYLTDNGIQIKWFAQKIGMNPTAFYAILYQKKSVPKKYWKAIILLTNRKISLKDLAEIDLDDQQDSGNKKSKKTE
jgi:hypothetical protein